MSILLTTPGWWRGTGGAGDREKRGLDVYGRRKKRGREAGFPRWREREKKGRITQHCAILRNLKKCEEAGANKYRAGTGIKGYGKRVVYTPCPSPPAGEDAHKIIYHV